MEFPGLGREDGGCLLGGVGGLWLAGLGGEVRWGLWGM